MYDSIFPIDAKMPCCLLYRYVNNKKNKTLKTEGEK